MKKILSLLLAVLVIATSCVCAVPALAADGGCAHDEISRTVYVYTAGENSTYTKTDYCYDANCKGKVEIADAGAANRCPRCYSRTLEKEEIVYANCIRGGYTEFTCTTCQISFKEKFLNKKEHNYIKTITAATCTKPGSTDYKCNCTKYGAPMDATKSDGHIPAKGHTIGKAGTTVTYEYFTELGIDKCRVSGTCMEYNPDDPEKHEAYSEDIKEYVIPETCPKCGSKVTKKTVIVPDDCTKGAKVTYECAKSDCAGAEVTALPVGHEIKSTTYKYNNGEYIGAEVDCYRCGKTPVTDDTYKYDTKCKLCDSALVERVVVAPTCSKTGHTQTTCAKGEKCIEATRPMLNHVAKVGEWNYHIEEGIYTYGASCSNYGCFGYSSSGQIGILGKCEKCKATGKLTYKKVTFADCISREYTNFKCNQCCPGSEDLIVDKNTKLHNTVSDVKAPTCTEAGGESTTCKNCYSTTTKETIPAKGHSIDISNKIYMKPAVDSNGNIIYDGNKIVYKNFLKSYGYCKLCKKDVESDLSSVPACERCRDGKIVQEVYIKPDCSGKGTSGHTRVYCSNGCHDNDTIGFYIPDSSIIPFAHVYGDWKITKAPTCSEDGEKVRTCSLCNQDDTVKIPANTTDSGEPKHMLVVMEYGYPATCTEDGRTNHTYCSQCGEFFPAVYIPATGHLLSPGTTNKNFCSRCNSYVIDEQEEGYVKVPLLDENGKPVYKIEGYETEVDEKGNTVYEVEHDEKGDVIYEKDIYGNVKFDENGEKIPVYKLDKYGQKIPVYKYDKNGNRIPIYAKDTNGNPIPLYKEVVCSCMCHNNDGLAKFFFKIIMFFCNIFGINQECDCGISHMITE